jgi:hypothetical protein
MLWKREVKGFFEKKGVLRRQTNLNIAIIPSERYLFFFNKEPVLCIFNCETGGDVVKVLNQFEFQLFGEIKIARVTALLKGERKIAYNWSCKKIT